MRITLKHIADDTGLSIATVSRALSRKIRNHSSSEEQIYISARKLGYPLITNNSENEKNMITHSSALINSLSLVEINVDCDMENRIARTNPSRRPNSSINPLLKPL